MSFLKELEGKTVYLRPTGNNARRGVDECSEATIVKVARVNCTIQRATATHTETFRHRGKHLKNGFNGGYQIYPTLQDFNDHQEVVRLSQSITKHFTYARDYEELSLSTLRQIAVLLDLDSGVSDK